MTKYEDVQIKIDLATQAACRTCGTMRMIWIAKAMALQGILRTLSIQEAMEVKNG